MVVLGIRNVYNKIFNRATPAGGTEQQVISRSEHGLSRQKLSDNALKVLYRLKKKGFSSYLVGGGVRDVLLDMPTKDFDIATDATPEQINRMFANSRIIGRRFRLVHIMFKNEIIEVSTFRAGQRSKSNKRLEMLRSDNTFGSLEDDVFRRDFTVNSLYYDIKDFSIVDYVGGWKDLQQRVLRFIGDPVQRVHEDPVRILRALRFAAKLNMTMDPATEEAVQQHGGLLSQVSPSRLMHEFEKLFCTGYAAPVFDLLVRYGYCLYLFDHRHVVNQKDSQHPDCLMIKSALTASDLRIKENKPLNIGFILGVFLWSQHRYHLLKEQGENKRLNHALYDSITTTLKEQRELLNVSKRMSSMMKSMWLLQYNLERRRPKRIRSLLKQRYYRAAFDLLVLRAEQDQELKECAQWWQEIYQADDELRDQMIDDLVNVSKKKSRRRQSKNKKNKT